MKINVRLFGIFQIDRFTQQVLEFPAGTRVYEVIDHLSLPPQLFGIVLINDLHAEVETILHEGDRLALLPLVDGG